MSNKPTPPDLWKQYQMDVQEEERMWRRDLKSIVFIGSCILAFFLVVWGTLP
jgi:hypothetical protein